uniref:tRNA nucleotidyltransferase/poly(A) polymerase RNA and SrmB- binding domain-containing protein n=1 Tax=Hucho hucho TaxID=62062 RepID=A0A4W5QG71_9TELE
MQLKTTEFQSLFSDGLNGIAELFEKYKFELRIAGGAVQDLLSGKEDMKNMFQTAGIRRINNKGEKHGTIPARLHNENFEVTTLQVDVHYRLAERCRDLAVNSMFLGVNVGLVKAGEHDPVTPEAIRENAHGLAAISGEHIWVELKKMVLGTHAAHSLEVMYELGLAQHTGEVESPQCWQHSYVYFPKTTSGYDAEHVHSTSLVDHEVDAQSKVCQLLKYQGEDKLLAEMSRWSIPRFPASRHDLRKMGITSGKKIGTILQNLRDSSDELYIEKLA